MNSQKLSAARARQIFSAAQKTRVLVVGDVMLDQVTWGGVSRISPEAPVPSVDFHRENFMPGGAASVARNLAALATPAKLFGAVGQLQGRRKPDSGERVGVGREVFPSCYGMAAF